MKHITTPQIGNHRYLSGEIGDVGFCVMILIHAATCLLQMWLVNPYVNIVLRTLWLSLFTISWKVKNLSTPVLVVVELFSVICWLGFTLILCSIFTELMLNQSAIAAWTLLASSFDMYLSVLYCSFYKTKKRNDSIESCKLIAQPVIVPKLSESLLDDEFYIVTTTTTSQDENDGESSDFAKYLVSSPDNKEELGINFVPAEDKLQKIENQVAYLENEIKNIVSSRNPMNLVRQRRTSLRR